MEIIVGKTAGFCAGVTNAVKKTESLLEEKKQIICLGELVHNAQVMKKLEEKGLKVKEQIDEVEERSILIIRAHGVPPIVYEKAKEKQINLVDLTCPKVLQIHRKAEEYKNDYYIFLIGAKEHPEVIGTYGFCGEESSIIEKENDIEEATKKFEKSNKKKLAIISQTTYSLKKFEELVEIIKEKLNETEILVDNTICNATSTRQKETEELSKIVDLMIVIGGKNSSNTRKLFELAKTNCNHVQIVETAEEIQLEEVKLKNKIGIMAGASTPKESIEEVIKKLKNS